MKVRKIIAIGMSILCATSIILSTDALENVRADQDNDVVISENGTMTVVSRRVTKSELYSGVSDSQKIISDDNPVAVVDEELNVNIKSDDVIDYIRFAGASAVPDQRKNNSDANEIINFSASYTSVAEVEDWTNLPISIDDGDATTTATNFRGEGTTLTFTVPTVLGEKRKLTIYAGGHPATGTITTSASIGNEAIDIWAGNIETTSYSYTPNSSQVTEYEIDYIGTGSNLVVSMNLTGSGGTQWAGIAVAAAVLQNDDDSPCIVVKNKVVSKSSIYSNVPDSQKTVNDDNLIAVEDKVIKLDLGASNILESIRFTGAETPVRYGTDTSENITFTSEQTSVSAISDWTNLSISDANGSATTTATNFLGENAKVTFSVETVAGEERILDIYAGGHPNTGTFVATAFLGNEQIPFLVGGEEQDTYSYTPNSSQIVHYQVGYTGNGEDFVFTISLSGTGNVSWAGIGVAAAVLRDNVSAISPQNGSFNKSTSDAEHRDVITVITTPDNSTVAYILLDNETVSEEDYIFDDETSELTFNTSYLNELDKGTYNFQIHMENGEIISFPITVGDASDSPRPYVKETESLSNSNLDAWILWYQDEFEDGLDDWWETSYLKWWNYSSESNEAYNTIEYSEQAGSNVLKQFTTETMRADSIVTRRDNFRNPGITLGVKDLIHNYAAKDLTNYQHMVTDDRGATAYGYFEIRAKITGGTTAKTQSGSSAWWFTGFQDASWQTVEVDMVEYGYGVSEDNLNAHFASPMHSWRDPFVSENNSTWNSTDKNLGVTKPADGYHIYGFEWTPTGMNGYFDGVLVWSKNMSVNYRMLMWISLNSHAYETYTTDAKSHYIDYVRIWKTDELEELEKQIVTKNIVQKLAPTNGDIATLAYASANGIRSSHYQQYDPGYMNDGDDSTSYRASTATERSTDSYPVTPYNNDEQYLYLDWVQYTDEEIQSASSERETITDLSGNSYTLASEAEIRSAKTIASIELVANKNVKIKSINANSSDNATGTFVYDEVNETANRFPYEFDVEYSEDGYNGWTPIATGIKAEWNFDESGKASFIANVNTVEDVNHLRIHVKSVWNSDNNQVENTDNGFYIAEIKVYENAKGNVNTITGNYYYNHAPYANVSVTDENGNAGSEDANFPVCDIADGVYVNEFRSSGDGTRLESNPNRVDTSIENVPDYPQYINFSWDTEKTISNFGITIGYASSAPTSYKLQALKEDGSWETLITANETWDDDFSSMNYDFDPVTTTQIRLVILEANKGPKIEYNGGIEGNGSRIVRIAGGYYSIAEVELNERK